MIPAASAWISHSFRLGRSNGGSRCRPRAVDFWRRPLSWPSSAAHFRSSDTTSALQALLRKGRAGPVGQHDQPLLRRSTQAHDPNAASRISSWHGSGGRTVSDSGACCQRCIRGGRCTATLCACFSAFLRAASAAFSAFMRRFFSAARAFSPFLLFLLLLLRSSPCHRGRHVFLLRGDIEGGDPACTATALAAAVTTAAALASCTIRTPASPPCPGCHVFLSRDRHCIQLQALESFLRELRTHATLDEHRTRGTCNVLLAHDRTHRPVATAWTNSMVVCWAFEREKIARSTC